MAGTDQVCSEHLSEVNAQLGSTQDSLIGEEALISPSTPSILFLASQGAHCTEF